MSDDLMIEVFSRMARAHDCSVDDILVTPELRGEYLAQTRSILGDLPERQILHRLVNLRKRSKLPRSRGPLPA
jgi:hypothetical protein